MKNIIALVLLAAFAVSPLAAQHATAGAGKAGARQNNSVPMSSPEPITMIALAGGAAAAGAFAGRRRKKQN
ncbi:MAG: PEP-CTERM sorting domain-containing protein [Planctomycetota bacterium]